MTTVTDITPAEAGTTPPVLCPAATAGLHSGYARSVERLALTWIGGRADFEAEGITLDSVTEITGMDHSLLTAAVAEIDALNIDAAESRRELGKVLSFRARAAGSTS